MKYIKVLVITIIVLLLIVFSYYVITMEPKLTRPRDIKRLRNATAISFNSKEIDIKYKDELIDIIERGEKSNGWHNLPTYDPQDNIDFLDKNDELIYILTFYKDEYDIGFQKREKTILEKDRERFLEILNYKDE